MRPCPLRDCGPVPSSANGYGPPAKKTHHGGTVMRWAKGMKGAAFPLLKNDRVRAGGVVRAEEGQHAARLPLLHAVGVEALGIRRRVQP